MGQTRSLNYIPVLLFLSEKLPLDLRLSTQCLNVLIAILYRTSVESFPIMIGTSHAPYDLSDIPRDDRPQMWLSTMS